MKSFFMLPLILLFLNFSAWSEMDNNLSYSLEENVSYYSPKEASEDNYLKERCVLDLYFPNKSEGFSTVVWFHGGALKGGEKHIPDFLKEKGIAVVAVNYRLHPKVKAPVYIEDAAAAVAWVIQNISTYGGDPEKIVVSGHSAGGYLTSMIGLDKHWLAKHQVDADRIAALVPFSGHTITHMTPRAERGISELQPIVDELAPLYHIREDSPPYIMITGDRELELLGRYEENAYMYRMMKLVGHTNVKLYELDGYDHGMVYPGMPILLKIVRALSN